MLRIIKKIGWDDVFLFLLWVFLASLISIIIIFSFSTKYTKSYSIGKDGDANISITKEIEWDCDEEIKLDRSITYWEAIRMVDSLNASLHKPKQ